MARFLGGSLDSVGTVVSVTMADVGYRIEAVSQHSVESVVDDSVESVVNDEE
jgi:hypothetical protein